MQTPTTILTTCLITLVVFTGAIAQQANPGSVTAAAARTAQATTKNPRPTPRHRPKPPPGREDVIWRDTSSAAVAEVTILKDGYRVLRRDLRMGVLNADLSVRVPFLYNDIQVVSTGVNPAQDFVFVGRKSWHGGYAVLDDAGLPTTDYSFTYSPRLRIFDKCIIDSPRPGRFRIHHREGSPVSPTLYTGVWPHPVLMSEGYHILNVQRGTDPKLALFDLDSATELTGFGYDRISMVDPVVAPRRYLPVLEAYDGTTITVYRPTGVRLSNVPFAGVEDYNNWLELREYFELPDDPTAEAIAWTKDMEVYVIYADDRVVRMGRFQ